MGLAAPRKRMKLSHDPNNTTWTRDTTSFGHKIMRSQGWQPGEYLGAKDAPHAEFHTSANATGIKVVLKDDNLGLGAKKGSGIAQGECTGLDVFQRLLGRLNGEDEEELAKEQKAKEDLRRAIYTEQRWGSIRFVRGGFLIGDKIQELIESEAERIRTLAGEILHVNGAGQSLDTHDKESEADERPKIRKEKKKKRKDRKDKNDDEAMISDDRSSKKDKKKKKKLKETEEKEAPIVPEKEDDAVEEPKIRKKKRKERTADKAAVPDTTEEQPHSGSEKPTVPGERNERTDFQETSSIAVASIETSSSELHRRGRHAVRSRHITQKRMAVLDTASLNQIFMIKPQSV